MLHPNRCDNNCRFSKVKDVGYMNQYFCKKYDKCCNKRVYISQVRKLGCCGYEVKE